MDHPSHSFSYSPSLHHYVYFFLANFTLAKAGSSRGLWSIQGFVLSCTCTHHSHIHIAIFSPPFPSITLPSETDGHNLKECKLEWCWSDFYNIIYIFPLASALTLTPGTPTSIPPGSGVRQVSNLQGWRQALIDINASSLFHLQPQWRS